MKSNDKDYWLIFQNNQAILNKAFGLLQLKDVSHLKINFTSEFHLGHFQGYNCYCAELDQNIDIQQDFINLSVRQALGALGDDWYQAITKGFGLIQWDKNNQFCGRCGSLTVRKEKESCRECTVCGHTLFPRISPSIIVRIRKGDTILMARSPHFTPGLYGLIAGFVDVGENLEQAVHREVMEEVNIEIKNLTYFGSQPWPFPDSLMIGFTADYQSGEIKIDEKEIESAGWYDVDHLPSRPKHSISISQKLVAAFEREILQKRNK